MKDHAHPNSFKSAGARTGLKRGCVPVALIFSLAFAAVAAGDAAYEDEPINYNKAPRTDVIAQLQKRLDGGQARLGYNEKHGFLDAVLKELKIPVSSQTLVFSKTSFQREKISPRHPRALYFNDDVYVGFVENGDVLEVAAADPNLGMNFYTLDQRQADRPMFTRQTDNCTQCHAGSMTRDVPGLMLRSVYPGWSGQPILSAGTFQVTHETPLKDRWGGWYVTGHHGGQRHMGNVVTRSEDDPEHLDREAGANLTDLKGKFNTAAYLSGQSDIAALMVLEHQAEMHNRITRASFGVRLALRDARVMNQALGRPADFLSDSTKSRIKSSCEPLVKYMLFSGEAVLTEPVEGTTTFAKDYAARGPRDSKGRTLRDLDLHKRLLKYPCSPLVYSADFDGLPDAAKQYVYHRLWEVLTGKDTGKDFSHLSADDRRSVLEILRDTKPDLPGEWKSESKVAS